MELFDPTLTDSLRSEDGCHSLQRTNIRLSANLKYVYDGDALYLESINSTRYLASAKFKAKRLNISVPLPYAVKTFMNESSDLTEWYQVKNINLNQSKHPFEQRRCNYEFGAYIDNSSPLSKNRFFAPLWVYDNLPDMFCIFRISNMSYKGDIKRILKDGKLVKAIDMRKGRNQYFDWIRAHITGRDFRSDAVQVDYSGAHKSISYYGFSAKNADWQWNREPIMEEYTSNERMIMEMNNVVTNGFQRNQLIHPSLFNFEFTFEDPTALDGWVQYVGFYVNTNELFETQTELRRILSQNPETLFINHHGGVYERTIEEKNPTLEVSNKVTGFKSENLPALAELNWLWIPPKNSIFRISFGNIIVYEFKFGSYNSVKAAKKAILDDFRTAKLNQVALRMYEDGDRFFVTAVNTAAQYENLELTLPSSIRSNYGFKIVGVNDVIVSKFPEEDVLTYQNENYIITGRYRYIDYYVIRLDKPITLTTTTNLELMRYVYPELLLCSYLPHKDFDYSIDRSSHYDPVDSEHAANKEYLLSKIAEPKFQGGWSADMGISLSEYKEKLKAMLDDHFKSIDIPKEFTLKDLDPVTLEATSTVPNEYMRLEESTNENTKDVNKITSFVTKWAHSQGTNVYARPYDLNVSLAMRYDNFAPSYTNSNRDLRTHTHSWYLIGEGVPPYFKNLRKAMGYTNAPITYFDLVDTDKDAYVEKLTHDIDGYKEKTWSEMKLRDGTENTYYTFFRGAELEFVGDYEGYRFASILTTKELVNNDSSVSDYIKFVDNAKFKTLTCLIRFYIPDPVLTSLEGGIPYYLDRSLLYFSNEVYSTKKIDAFGQDVISLDLYNTTTTKVFGGQVLESKDWRHYDAGNTWETYYYIRKGDVVRWNGNFQDMLVTGDSFYWRTVRDDGSTIVDYWAENIIDVNEDYFWCKDILYKQWRTELDPETNYWRSLRGDMSYYENLGFDGTELFKRDNEWYMSKAIAYNNAIYDIIVSARTNTKRYKQIAFGALVNILNNYAIKYTYVNDDRLTESEKRCQVYEPSYFPILNAIRSENSQLVQMENGQLIIPIYRYSGTYSPVFRTIYHGAKLNGDRDELGTIKKINEDLRYIKKYSTRQIENQIDIEKRDYTISEVFDKTLKLYADETNYSIVNRNSDLNASQSFISTVFKYPDEFEVIADKALFNLRDLTQPIILPLIADQDFVRGTMSQANLLEILRVYVPRSTVTSMLLEDVQKYVYTDFFEGTLMDMYAIDKILTSDGQIIQYTQQNSYEYLMEANYGRIILKRHK